MSTIRKMSIVIQRKGFNMRIFSVFMMTSCLVCFSGNSAEAGSPVSQNNPTSVSNLSSTQIVNVLMTSSDCGKLVKFVMELDALPKAIKDQLLLSLPMQLDNMDELPLTNLTGTAIESRLRAGEMQWHGHGILLKQDIMTKGGRAAWALEKLLKEKLPAIEKGLSKQEIETRVKTIKDKVKQKLEASTSEQQSKMSAEKIVPVQK
jgi:hypothetical protein